MNQDKVTYTFEITVDASEADSLVSLNDYWWVAKYQGKVGLLPENYIRVEARRSIDGSATQRKLKPLEPSSSVMNDIRRIKEQRLQADEKIENLRKSLTSIEKFPSSSQSKSSDLELSPFQSLMNKLEDALDEYLSYRFDKVESNMIAGISSIVRRGKSKDQLDAIRVSSEELASQSSPLKLTEEGVKLPSMKGDDSAKSSSDISEAAKRLQRQQQQQYQQQQLLKNGEASDGFKYPQCRSLVYKPSYFRDNSTSSSTSSDVNALIAQPNKSLALEYIYGYDGDRGRHGNTAIGKNIILGIDDTILYPIAAMVVIVNLTTYEQSFFPLHSDVVTCVSCHPKRNIAASGQIGRPGRILVWEYNNDKSKRTLDEDDVVVEFAMGGEVRSVRSLDFSADGKFLVALGLDDVHSIVVFDWSSLTTVASAKLGHVEISQIGFNPFLMVTMDPHAQDAPNRNGPAGKAQGSHEGRDHGCYTLVSCGGKHIKFWTLTRSLEIVPVPVPDGANEPSNPSPKRDRRPQGAGPAMMSQFRYELEGNVGTTPRSSNSSEALEFTCFACVNDSENNNRNYQSSRILSATSGGSIMIWQQLEDDEALYSTGYQGWQPRGRLISVVTQVHDQGIADMTYFNGWNEVTNRFADKLITSSNRDGFLHLWRFNRTGDVHALPLDFVGSISLEDHLPSSGFARSITWDHGGQDVITGTSMNDILRIPQVEQDLNLQQLNGDGSLSARGLDGTTVEYVVQGHNSKVRHVSAHPNETCFATVSSDQTLRIWDAMTHQNRYTMRLSFLPTCVSYSVQGDHLVVGNDLGEIVVWDISEDATTSQAVVLDFKFKKSVAAKVEKILESSGSSGSSGRIGNANNSSGQPMRAEVVEVKYSPQGDILAVACRDNLIHILSVKSGYKRIAVCRGHSSAIRAIDFSLDGSLLQSCDTSRELLYFDVTSGKLIPQASQLRDVQWSTWSCLVGWPVQGIFDNQDGKVTDGEIHAVCRSGNQDLVVAGSSESRTVKLFNYPCLPASRAKMFGGHSSPTLDVKFLTNDSHVISVGGNDTSIFQWKVI